MSDSARGPKRNPFVTIYLLTSCLAISFFVISLTACQRQNPPNRVNLQAVTVAHDLSTFPTSTPFQPYASPTPINCTADEITDYLNAIPDYSPTDRPFIRLENNQLIRDEEPFIVRGFNYFPIEYPFWRFLQVDRTTLTWDMSLMAESGVNTLRIFVWNEPLFTCPNQGAIPLAPQFERLDGIIEAAALQNLYLIITLHEQANIMQPSFYENPTAIMAQTEYIVQRYKDEPTILAWDLRDAGDADYQGGVIGGIQRDAKFERRTVVDWLIRTAAAIRAIDDQHIITAGWNDDSAATHIAVDMISFQYWDDPEQLRSYINELDQQVDKPLLLISIGYDSQTHNPSEQSSMLREALNAAEQSIGWEQIVGWLVWTTFDFAPGSACDLVACPDGNEDPRYHFGLWDIDRNPKPAVNVIDVITQPPIVIPTATPSPES